MQNQTANPTHQKLDALKDAILGMTEHVKQVASAAKLPDRRFEVVTIGPSGYDVDLKGYTYLGLFVSDQETITVDYLGITYPITINQPFTNLIVPHGARLTADSPFSGLMVWSASVFQ